VGNDKGKFTGLHPQAGEEKAENGTGKDKEVKIYIDNKQVAVKEAIKSITWQGVSLLAQRLFIALTGLLIIVTTLALAPRIFFLLYEIEMSWMFPIFVLVPQIWGGIITAKGMHYKQ